jgi:C-terminal processing protease CtpA/Prc
VPSVQSATFTLETDEGKTFDLPLTPIDVQPDLAVRFTPASTTIPVSRQHPTDALWFTLLPDGETVYVNFRRYDTLGRDARALFDFVDSSKAKRLVIDLRQNGGGDFKKGRRYLVERVKDRPQINAKGHLYVLIGRRTFSAALANAVDFRKDTQATLVGEPIGERPNSYSENDEMTLPHSKLIVSYSTRYYRFSDEDVPAILPDVRIDPAWSDFKAGRDAALEWALANR